MLETDVPETLNEMLLSVRKMGRCGIIAAYAGFANGVNVGALMEKGVRFVSHASYRFTILADALCRLIGNGQAPVHLYWKEILEEFILSGAFDPTL
jgi:threonine dehydrogenase-like Zn-dependent dehydrogenase